MADEPKLTPGRGCGAEGGMSDAWVGRPQNPERDGEHMMEVTDHHGRVWHEVWRWQVDGLSWLRPNFVGPVYGYEPRDLTTPTHRNLRYLGPCALPGEVATLRADNGRLVAALAETHAENARLREALGEAHEALAFCVTPGPGCDDATAVASAIATARAALSEPAP